MKTFREFITEVYDKDVMGSSQIRRTGEGGRIGAERKKTKPEMRRMKPIGGGKTAPSEYKARKDIGTQRPRSAKEQQPTQERGSAADAQKAAAKAERKKAAQARIAARKSGKAAPEKKSTPTASQLLSKKAPEKKTNPNYKGDANVRTTKGVYTKDEKKQIRRAGERLVRDIQKKREKPASNYNVNLKR